MKRQLLKKTLRQLLGHIVIESDKERRNFELLHKSLTKTVLPDDRSLTIKSDFSIGNSDLFFDETIPEKRLGILDKLAKDTVESDRKAAFQRSAGSG